MRIIARGVTYQIIGGPAVLGRQEGIEMMLEKIG
jgi:hypothetical protein